MLAFVVVLYEKVLSAQKQRIRNTTTGKPMK